MFCGSMDKNKIGLFQATELNFENNDFRGFYGFDEYFCREFYVIQIN